MGSPSPAAHAGLPVLLNEGINESTPLLVSAVVIQSTEPSRDVIAAERASWSARPWWRRPSVWWPIITATLFGLSLGMTLGPRVELITMLVCAHHKPEYVARGQRSELVLNVAERIGEKCQRDPVILAAVAKLMTAMATVSGVLGCMTVAWWGAASDRLGRGRIIAVTGLGILAQDANLIFTAQFREYLPGGYWFLLSSAIFEGVLGGASLAAASTVATAYISDCAEPSSRSRVFSTLLGFMLSAAAVGPTFGGLLLRLMGQDPFYIFYVAVALDLFFVMSASTLLPESLTPTQLRLAQRAHAEERARTKESSGQVGLRGQIMGLGRWLASFVTPLAVFLPARSGGGRDWALTIVVMSSFSALNAMGAAQFTIQYLYSRFGWTSEQGGYFLSITIGARSVFLTLILPLVIKWVRPKLRNVTHNEENSSFTTSENADQTPIAEDPANAPSDPGITAQLDHKLGLLSLAFEVIAHAMMPLAPSGVVFIAIAGLGSIGSGYQPAIQSLVLALHSQRHSVDGVAGGEVEDAGKLFGALSIMETFASGVTGPALFGIIFMNTVEVFPAAIFLASAACFALSFVLLSLVRVPRARKPQLAYLEPDSFRTSH